MNLAGAKSRNMTITTLANDPTRGDDTMLSLRTAEVEALQDTPGSCNGLEGKLDMQGVCHDAGLVGAIS